MSDARLEIFGIEKLPNVPVEIPEMGKTYYMRAMTAEEFKTAKYDGKTIVKYAVDENDELIFTEKDDWKKVENLPVKIFQRFCMALTQANVADVEELKKK